MASTRWICAACVGASNAWYSDLLLQLYCASRELSVAEFPNYAFCLIKLSLRFDSARYTSLKISEAGSVVQTAHLHNDSNDTVFDWEQINRHDSVVPTVTAVPGRAFAFHARTLFSTPEKRVMRDYTERTRHENMLVCAHWNSTERLWKSLSLYRAGPNDQYTECERNLLQLLMPHILQALRINVVLGSVCVRSDTGLDGLAIADSGGIIHYAGPGFVELLRAEWPGSCAVRLPAAVQQWTQRIGSTEFRGRSVSIGLQVIENLLFLRARPLARGARLSGRELRVAALYGNGRSHKDVARDLGIGPATARNHLQHIYAKLGIGNKAQLAALLARDLL